MPTLLGTSPKPLTDTVAKYSFRIYDQTLDLVALRYDTTIEEIRQASKTLSQFSVIAGDDDATRFVAMVELSHALTQAQFDKFADAQLAGKFAPLVKSWRHHIEGEDSPNMSAVPIHRRKAELSGLMVARLVKQFAFKDAAEFNAQLVAWKELLIPFPDAERGLAWSLVKCGPKTSYQTLAAVAKAANEDLRRGTGIALTPKIIFDYLANAGFRKMQLSPRPYNVGTTIGEDEEPDKIVLAKGSTVQIPFPLYEVIPANVAPEVGSVAAPKTPSTLQAQPIPKWVDEFYKDFLEPIQTVTAKLRRANEACATLRLQCAQQVAQFATVDWLLSQMTTAKDSSVEKLREYVLGVQALATTNMSVNPAAVMDTVAPHADHRARSLEDGKLTALLKHEDFLFYVIEALKAPELTVKVGAAALGRKGGPVSISVCEFAYYLFMCALAELWESGMSDWGYETVGHAYAAIGTDMKFEAATTAAGAFFGALGQVPKSVGNFPGTRSFAVALVGWHGERSVVKMSKKYSTWAVESEQIENKLRIAAKAAGLTDAELNEITTGLRSPKSAVQKKARAKLSRKLGDSDADSFRVGGKLNKFVAGVTAVCFLYALWELDWDNCGSWKKFTDDNSTQSLLNVTGAGIGSAVALFTVMAEPTGKAALFSAKYGWANSFGRLAAFLSVVSATMDAVDLLGTWRKGGRVTVGEVAMVGANLGGAIAILWGTPGCQAIGAGVLVVVGLVQLWPTIKGVFTDSENRSAVKAVIVGNAEYFGKSWQFQRVAKADAELRRLYDALLTVLDEFDNYGSLAITSEVDDALKQMGFMKLDDRVLLMNGTPESYHTLFKPPAI